MDPIDHLKEVKATLIEAIETIDLGPLLPRKVIETRLEHFKRVAAAMAPMVTEATTVESCPPLRVYLEQLESIARRVAQTAGADGERARLILSPANQKVIGLDLARPITGKVRIVDMRPSLKERCTATGSGEHETFQEGRKTYCRACGVEEHRVS